MSKKFVLAVIVVALALGAFGAAAAQEPVTINWWHIGTVAEQGAYWQEMADEFTAMNPNVTIDITILENEAFKSQLVTVMQGNDPPDLFHSWGGGVLWQFADAGLLRNIAPELEGDWKDSFSAQAALELYGRDGEYYGVPWSWGAVGFFYNKALFAQAGLDPENPPATWDEFVSAIQALQDAGPVGDGVVHPRDRMGLFWRRFPAFMVASIGACTDAMNKKRRGSNSPMFYC